MDVTVFLLLLVLPNCVIGSEFSDENEIGTTTASPMEGLIEEEMTPDLSRPARELSPAYSKPDYEVANILEPPKLSHSGAELEAWDPPSHLKKNYPYYLAGFHDEESKPIWVAEVGRFDIRRIVEDGDSSMKLFDKYLDQGAWTGYKVMLNASTKDEPVSQSILVLDFDDFSLRQMAHPPTVAYMMELSRRYRDLAEKYLNRAFALNVNYVAKTLITLVKPILGSFFEKVEMYGSNKAEWIPKFLRHVPRDQIPEWYGGSKDFIPVQIYG